MAIMRDILLKHGNNNIFRNITTLEQTAFRQSEAGLVFQMFLIARTIWLGAHINMAIMRDISLKHGNNNIFRNITTLEQTAFRQSEAGLVFQMFLIARTIWLGAPINMAIMRDISLKHGNHNISKLYYFRL